MHSQQIKVYCSVPTLRRRLEHRKISLIKTWWRMIMWVNWVIFGAGNGLLRIWQQAITVINADLLWLYTYKHILMLFE